jgi:RNA recognition motif-containing protein
MAGDMARFIQVGNLHDSVDGHALRSLFESFGRVRTATIHRHRESSRSMGVGMVEMESEDDGDAAITALHHREHVGRVLSVCWSVRQTDPGSEQEQMTNLTSEEATRRVNRNLDSPI